MNPRSLKQKTETKTKLVKIYVCIGWEMKTSDHGWGWSSSTLFLLKEILYPVQDKIKTNVQKGFERRRRKKINQHFQWKV